MAALHSLTTSTPTYRLTLTGYQPSVYKGIFDVPSDELIAQRATMEGTGTKGGVYAPQRPLPNVGSASFTGYQPTAVTTFALAPSVGALGVTGYQLTLNRQYSVFPSTGSLSVTANYSLGYGALRYGWGTYGTARTPTVGVGSGPQTGVYAFIGYTPAVVVARVVSPSTGTLTLSGQTLSLGIVVQPSTGAVSVTGYAPTLIFAPPIAFPSTTAYGFTGYQPSLRRGEIVSPVFTAFPSALEPYTYTVGFGQFVSDPATVEFNLGQTYALSFEFYALPSSVYYRDWSVQQTPSDSWTLETEDTDDWTVITNPPDKFNG